MPDYMPRRDSDFLMWAANFSAYLTGHAAEFGLSPQQAGQVSSAVAAMEETIGRHNTARQAAQSVRQQKDDAREGVEEVIRTLVRQLQAMPSVSNAQRESLGITVAGKGKAAADNHLPSCPKATVNTSQRLRHIIRYRDQANPARRARPAHTLGCEIWVYITGPQEAAPADPGKFRNLGLNTASPFVMDHDGADGGKMAHYMLRWVSTDGRKGPWGEGLSATIVG